MERIRVFLLLLTMVVVGVVGTFTFLYAKGYRFDKNKGSLSPSGLLVIKSIPDGAQVFINGDLKSATNTTISLPPGTYDIKVTKDSYTEWKKRLEIQKEIVTEATANLFKTTLSLTSVTSSGALNPSISPDLSKIAYIIRDTPTTKEVSGLWVLENINLPLGFSRDAKRITDGNLSESTWLWSPNSREILLTTPKGNYILDISKFTPQTQMVNITNTKTTILEKWQKEASGKRDQLLKTLPDKLSQLLSQKTSSTVFSPDEDLVLYKASSAFDIPDELIKPFPGASTQKQERTVKEGQTYIYDIKEDRNFLMDEDPQTQIFGTWIPAATLGENDTPSKRSISWYPSSRHLIASEEGRISVLDYDGTNRQTVYSGSYFAPFAFPTYSLDKILILTNLGASDQTPNLYSLSIK